MNHYTLWITHHEAIVFKFTDNGIEEQKLKLPTHKSHHTGNLKDSKHHHQYEAFYKDVSEHLKGAEELLVIGPGVAKDEFKHHCEKNHHESLGRSIVGVENFTSHPTKSELIDKAIQFFSNFKTWK